MNERAVCIPGWHIVRTIGKGGFGTVYEIEKDGTFGRGVRSALKVISIPESQSEIVNLRNEGYDEGSLTELFKSRVEDITSEFRLMNRLKGSSNVVSFEDFLIVQHDDDPGYDVMIRMELLTSLPEYVHTRYEKERITDTFVRKIGTDICSALELCCECSIIHRDIKPQNIFVNAYGDFKLGDFGVAKTSDHTTRATKTGTFGYMAPEVYWGKPYNAQVDIYSLGLVMYWMLNERRGPFLPLPPVVPKSAQSAEALDRRMSGEPLPAPKHGSEELKRIVLKACAFDPKDRYARPEEMRYDLEMLFAEADAFERTLKMKNRRYDEGIDDISNEKTLVMSEDSITQLIGPVQADEEATLTSTANTSPEDLPVPEVSKKPEPIPADDEATIFLKESTPVKPAEEPVEPKKEARSVNTNPAKKETKPAEKQQKKKSMLLIILPIAAVVVIAAVVLIVVFAGKGKTSSQTAEQPIEEPIVTAVASADGESISFAEYKVMFDSVSMNYTDTTLDDDQIRRLQEYCANEVIKQKIYEKEAKALGLSLTDEQITLCKKAADEQIASIEQYYANNLIQNGSYSKTALDKQLSAYYQSLGMGSDAYRAFLIQNAASEYFHEAILQYYQENGSGIDENTLVDYYRENVEASMTTEDEDGKEISTYTDGAFWNYMMMYQIGYSSPMLYVPDGFIYIDFIELEKSDAAEIAKIVDKVNAGELSFDELKESDENRDSFKGAINGPYPIAENDHAALFIENEIFLKAALLSVGDIDAYVGAPVENDDGTQTVTAYLFRRAEGNLCYDGDHGVIKLDCFPGIRASVVEQYWLEQWFADVKFDDVIYTYRGTL